MMQKTTDVRAPESTRGRLESGIKTLLEDRTGRGCLFVPSGRFGLYLAFRTVLSPGDRILMSALEDDTVFYGALAAGLRPVMAPVSSSNGNIDPEAVPDQVWSRIGGVLTMNMYGIPDQVVNIRSRCERLGIPLIEDVAHALETDVDGHALGTFGTIAAFSLSKHVPGAGGVLAFRQDFHLSEALDLIPELVAPRTVARQAQDLLGTSSRALLDALCLRQPLWRVRQKLRVRKTRDWRIALRASQLEAALATRTLDHFDPWMNVAYPDYRMEQQISRLEKTIGYLRNLDRDREQRIEGVIRLRELGELVAPGAREGTVHPMLRVPLLVEDRNAVADELERRGVNVYFLYDPPLDDHAGLVFTDPSPAPDVARWWAAHVLPVDPREAERVLEALSTLSRPLRAAPPPPA